MLDLILSAAKGKAPGEDGITAEVLAAGGRPMAQLLQPLFSGMFAKSLAYCVEGVYHGNHSEWKEENERSHVERPCGEDLGTMDQTQDFAA